MLNLSVSVYRIEFACYKPPVLNRDACKSTFRELWMSEVDTLGLPLRRI